METVRQSGVSEKSKDGHNVTQYLEDLEADGDDDNEMEIDKDYPSGEMSEALIAQLNVSATSEFPLMARKSFTTNSSMTSNGTKMTSATNRPSVHSQIQAPNQTQHWLLQKAIWELENRLFFFLAIFLPAERHLSAECIGENKMQIEITVLKLFQYR